LAAQALVWEPELPERELRPSGSTSQEQTDNRERGTASPILALLPAIEGQRKFAPTLLNALLHPHRLIGKLASYCSTLHSNLKKTCRQKQAFHRVPYVMEEVAEELALQPLAPAAQVQPLREEQWAQKPQELVLPQVPLLVPEEPLRIHHNNDRQGYS